MPRINLLPTRATLRLEAARQELAVLIGGLVFVLFGLYLWHGVTQGHIEDSTLKAAALSADLTDLQKKVSQIETFKSEAAHLEKKLAIIDTLARSRTGPVRVLDGLAQAVNNQPKIWLTKLTEKDGQLLLEGGAMEQQDVSNFHLALEQMASLFRSVKLTLVSAQKDKEAESLGWVISCTPIYEAG